MDLFPLSPYSFEKEFILFLLYCMAPEDLCIRVSRAGLGRERLKCWNVTCSGNRGSNEADGKSSWVKTRGSLLVYKHWGDLARRGDWSLWSLCLALDLHISISFISIALHINEQCECEIQNGDVYVKKTSWGTLHIVGLQEVLASFPSPSAK